MYTLNILNVIIIMRGATDKYVDATGQRWNKQYKRKHTIIVEYSTKVGI